LFQGERKRKRTSKKVKKLLTNPKEHDIINSQQGKENPKKPERNLL